MTMTQRRSEPAVEDYVSQREANRRLWAKRAARHGGALEATASTAWVRAGTLRRLHRLIRRGDRVLEVGCGNGNLLRALPVGCRVIGADLTMEMLVLARRESGGGDDLVRADAASLPFQDESFDVVYTSRSLINVQERGMQDAALRDLLRVVKRTGTVMLSENFEEPVTRLNQCKLRFRSGPPDNDPHNLRLNLADTLRMFERAGWATKRVEGYPITSFVAHVIVGRLTRRRGGRVAQRLLSPLYAALARCDDLLCAWFPAFGKDTTIVLRYGRA
jgi:SAM-dependent methyltransferase